MISDMTLTYKFIEFRLGIDSLFIKFFLVHMGSQEMPVLVIRHYNH